MRRWSPDCGGPHEDYPVIARARFAGGEVAIDDATQRALAKRGGLDDD
jgi:hypothetical protein